MRQVQKLIAGVIVIVFAVTIVLPAINQSSVVNGVTQAGERRGVDASALFYTETRQVIEAQHYLAHAPDIP